MPYKNNQPLKAGDRVIIKLNYERDDFPAQITAIIQEENDDSKTIVRFNSLDGSSRTVTSCHSDFVTETITPDKLEIFC